MKKNKPHLLINLLRITFAAFGFLALSIMITDAYYQPFSLLNLFSYFTVESNLFAMIILLLSAVWYFTGRDMEKLSLWRGAATLYMFITGVIYFLLLRDVEFPLVLREWIDFSLHNLLPVILVLDWVLEPPKKKINFWRALVWLVFPVIYLVYSLVRGLVTQWYPYPFLDPGVSSYFNILLMSLLITVCFLAGAWVLSALSGRPQAHRKN